MDTAALPLFDPAEFERIFRALREEYGNSAVITIFLPSDWKNKMSMDYPLHFFVRHDHEPIVSLYLNQELDGGSRMTILSVHEWRVEDLDVVQPGWHIEDTGQPVDFWERIVGEVADGVDCDDE